jgi:DNA invertase Pin-like site-specific DNA recombinase
MIIINFFGGGILSKIAYIRVSTFEQNTERQEVALKEIGMDKYYIEKASGKNTDRTEFKKMMEYVREGDTLYIESISRLARSTKDLLNIVEQLKNKRVEMVSLKENIDTHTPQGKFMLTVFGALAELERENILQRQKEGIQVARANGKQFGRPLVEVPKNFEIVYNNWKHGELTAVKAFKELKLKKTTFYKLVKLYEKQRIPEVSGD